MSGENILERAEKLIFAVKSKGELLVSQRLPLDLAAFAGEGRISPDEAAEIYAFANVKGFKTINTTDLSKVTEIINQGWNSSDFTIKVRDIRVGVGDIKYYINAETPNGRIVSIIVEVDVRKTTLNKDEYNDFIFHRNSYIKVYEKYIKVIQKYVKKIKELEAKLEECQSAGEDDPEEDW